MIILDLSQVMIATLMVQLGNHTNTEVDENLLRHMVLNSIRANKIKFSDEYGELVIAADGKRSWRKEVFAYYKANRKRDRDASELNWNQIFEALNKIRDELKEVFPYRVIHVDHAEADDIIARFIHLHPDDSHYIISSDTDYIQLIANNVFQYNGITNQLITTEGYFDDKGRIVVDKKTKEPKLLGDPKFVLFEKCMRGDVSDNVFSAFPGVRTKGTKNRVGLQEAFQDRHNKGLLILPKPRGPFTRSDDQATRKRSWWSVGSKLK